jgi:O-antigen ligase
LRESKKLNVLSEGITSTIGVAYVFVLFVAGFLTNFVPTGSVNTGTILLYSLAGLLSFVGGLHLLNPIHKSIATAALSMLGLSCLTLFKAAVDTNPLSQRALELAIFFLGGWPFLFFIQIDSPRLRERLVKTLVSGLFALSTFAIFQSVFANSLPLSLFVLRGDNAFGVGDDQFRPTALTGNPIIFSSILVFASALFAALWLEKRKLRFLLALVCSLVANYLTYTRTSIVLVIPVLLLVWLFHNRFRVKHKILTVGAVILAAAGGQYLSVAAANLIIIQRLQTSNSESLVSTLDHYKQIQDAAEAILSHPLLGTGMGSQGSALGPENVLITDGTWWILFLEFGGPLLLLVVASILWILITISKWVLRLESKDRAFAIATLSFHAYILPANFVNSALLGHVSFGLYWVALGLSLASIKINSSLQSARVSAPVVTSWKGAAVS